MLTFAKLFNAKVYLFCKQLYIYTHTHKHTHTHIYIYSCGPPLMDVQVWDDQHELTYSSYVRTRVVILKTCRRRWVIGRNGERRSGISAQTARHDDDDDIYVLFSPVELESGIILSGQKIIQLWTSKFSWLRAQCNRLHRAIISLRKTKKRSH